MRLTVSPGRLTALVLCGLMLAAPSLAGAAKGPNIAVVDVARVLSESKAGQELKSRLEKLQGELQTGLSAKTSQVQTLREEIAAKQGSAKPEDLEVLQQELQIKTAEAQREMQAANKQLQQAQQAGLSGLQDKLVPIVKDIGKERDYTLVMQRIDEMLLYVDDAADITDLVIQRLDAK
jgi:Skp family chaperone for outer membrane proteins